MTATLAIVVAPTLLGALAGAIATWTAERVRRNRIMREGMQAFERDSRARLIESIRHSLAGRVALHFSTSELN